MRSFLMTSIALLGFMALSLGTGIEQFRIGFGQGFSRLFFWLADAIIFHDSYIQIIFDAFSGFAGRLVVFVSPPCLHT